MAGFENRYGLLERVLHRVAFASGSAQLALADVEDWLYGELLSRVQVHEPVFISGLPRAGTTLLLELAAELPEFGAHTYRDLPFVLCPLLWSRFSVHFQHTSAARERLHGDGMLISTDSPEALEEVVWKHFWPAHYKSDRIEPWGPAAAETAEPEFQPFLASHMRKIVALRCGAEARGRYLSKNNLNIARLAALPALLPGATVVVPFREPVQHAASLLHQHRHFARIHAQDRFAREYMADLGHYEFGQNLRPVDFGGWLALRRSESHDELGFWLEYWMASYRQVLAQLGERVHLVSYDALCRKPAEGLFQLAELLGCEDSAALARRADAVRAPRLHDVDEREIDAQLLSEARALCWELEHAARI